MGLVLYLEEKTYISKNIQVMRKKSRWRDEDLEILSVAYHQDLQLRVFISDGTSKIIDLGPFILSSNHPLIYKYAEVELFKQVKLDLGVLSWGDGEMDFSPWSIIDGKYDLEEVGKKGSKRSDQQIMAKSILVKLSEKDVNQAITDFVKKHYNADVRSMSMSTGVRGDYDKGTSEEFVKTVWCDCESLQGR
jgi:hypothetical protein